MTRPLPITYEEAERVYQCAIADGRRSVVVTSSLPGEGSSTVAYALAQRLSAMGRSVLLADFNAASSYAERGLALERGAWDLDPAGPQPQPYEVPGGRLAILPAPICGFPAIGSRDETGLQRVLDGWLGRFDMVIADAPPLAPSERGGIPTDLLARVFDAVMLVVMSDATPGNAVDVAVRRLRAANAEIAGIILNDRDMPPLHDELVRQAGKLGRRGAPLVRLVDRALGRLGLMSVDF